MEDMINDLKNICKVLGLSIDENGKKECDLAHLYLQRIQTFLGA